MTQLAGESTAESWLLPELGDARIVQAERRNAGYSARTPTHRHAQREVRAELHGPLTRSRLDELAREAREHGHDSGRAEGYQKGYAEGEARARELGREQTEQLQAQLRALVDAVTVQVTAEQAALTEALVIIVRKIAEGVCLRELSAAAAQSIPLIVKRALAALPMGEQHVSLRMHPADLEILRAQPGLVKPEWQLAADEKLQRGDAFIDAEFSHVDASIERRLQEIVAAVFEDQRETGKPEED
ncbi:MAG: FliH/SctL family protein [Pseudomonadales bacterium]